MSRASGFKPLKPGRIHLRCPSCGRKQSNMPRHPEHDHPTAFMVEDECEKCGQGNFSSPAYFDKRGRELDSFAFMNRRAAASLGDTPDPNQGGK